MREFFIKPGDDVVGPLTGIEVREHALAGNVTHGTPIARNRNGPWVPAIQAQNLFDRHGKPLPHPPETIQWLERLPTLGGGRHGRAAVGAEDRETKRAPRLRKVIGCSLAFVVCIAVLLALPMWSRPYFYWPTMQLVEYKRDCHITYLVNDEYRVRATIFSDEFTEAYINAIACRAAIEAVNEELRRRGHVELAKTVPWNDAL